MYLIDGLGNAGSEPIDVVLRRRGHDPITPRDRRDRLFIPTDSAHLMFPGSKEDDCYFRAWSKSSFRKVIRKLLSAHRGWVDVEDLKMIAGKVASGHIDLLVRLGLVEHVAGQVRTNRRIDNIGPSLEWYVSQVCICDLCCTADWGVKLEGLPTMGGDYDVIAWLAPILMYIELKSSAPQNVSASQLKHFLQRSQELAPEVAILLVDTEDELSILLEELQSIMIEPVRVASGISDPTWRPQEPFIHPQKGYPGVSFGYRRFYVTNSQPSILTQLRRCLQHYNACVKGTSFWGGPTINFVTGEVG